MLQDQGLDLGGGAGFHRVWQDEGAQRRHAARPAGDGGQVGEHLGDHEHGRHAAAFAFNRVVDTPRRTRPSSAEADDGGIDAVDEAAQLVTFLGGGADAHTWVEQHDIAHAQAAWGLAL